MDIPSADGPPLINATCTEPYYTKLVQCIDKYGHSATEPNYTTYV